MTSVAGLPARGRQVGGWTLETLIGRGADSTVWKVRGAEGRGAARGAMKILDREAAQDGTRRGQFAAEVDLGRRIRGDGLVACLDAGESDGRPWAVFELVDGRPLEELLARGEGLDVIWSLHVLRELARALAVLHGLGWVHGDVKPANVLLDGRGRIRLVDYGSAQVLHGRSDGRGTPAYQAPEQLRRDEVEASTDLYALGLVLGEMITGERIMRPAADMELYRQHAELQGRLPRLSRMRSDVPELVDEIFRGLLCFRPDHRPHRSALALAECIDHAMERCGWDCFGRGCVTRGGHDGTGRYFRAVTCALEGRWDEARRGLRILDRLPRAEAARLRGHLESLVMARLHVIAHGGATRRPGGSPGDRGGRGPDGAWGRGGPGGARDRGGPALDEELGAWIDMAETAGLDLPPLLARELRLLAWREEEDGDRLRRLELLVVRGEVGWSELREAMDLAGVLGRSDLAQALRPLMARHAAQRGWEEAVRDLLGLSLLPDELALAVTEERALRSAFLEKTRLMLEGGDLEGVRDLARRRLERLPGDLDGSLRLAHVEERLGRRDEAARAWLTAVRTLLERGMDHRAWGALHRAIALGGRREETELFRRILTTRRSSRGSRGRSDGRTIPRPSSDRIRSLPAAAPSPCG